MNDKVIECAQSMVSFLVKKEMRHPREKVEAMKRLAKKSNIPYGTIWALFYRPPSDMLVSTYFALSAMYENVKQKQIEKLGGDIERTRAIRGPNDRAVVQAETFYRQIGKLRD